MTVKPALTKISQAEHMSEMRLMIPPEIWMRKVFDAKAARDGQTVRRNLRDIDRIVGRGRFLREIERRGFHAVENAGQIIVFCNNETVKLLC